jgi:hypothetical protein
MNERLDRILKGAVIAQNLPERNQDSRRIINMAGARSQLLPITSLQRYRCADALVKSKYLKES